MRTQNLLAALVTAGALTMAGGALGQTTPASSMSQSQIRQVQQALSNAGHDLQVDGKWGPNTREALRDFQQDRGLQATGRLDRDTMAALDTGGGSMAGGSGSRDHTNAGRGNTGPDHMGSRAKGSTTSDRVGLEKASPGGMSDQTAVSGSSGPGPSHMGSRAKGSTQGPNSLGNAPSGSAADTTSGVAGSRDAAGPSHMGSRAKGSTTGPESLGGKTQ